jgi:hypothetical protein
LRWQLKDTRRQDGEDHNKQGDRSRDKTSGELEQGQLINAAADLLMSDGAIQAA